MGAAVVGAAVGSLVMVTGVAVGSFVGADVVGDRVTGAADTGVNVTGEAVTGAGVIEALSVGAPVMGTGTTGAKVIGDPVARGASVGEVVFWAVAHSAQTATNHPVSWIVSNNDLSSESIAYPVAVPHEPPPHDGVKEDPITPFEANSFLISPLCSTVMTVPPTSRTGLVLTSPTEVQRIDPAPETAKVLEPETT